MKHNHPGLFLTVEGLDYSGKSTQLCLLTDYVQTKYGIWPVHTREPGGTCIGERLREMLLKGSDTAKELDAPLELLFFNASRRVHMNMIILPALQTGNVVFCDRFHDSTVAYQGFGRGLGEQYVLDAHKMFVDLEPDLTLLFDIPLDVWQSRKERRAELPDRFEGEAKKFFERVRDGYLHLACENPQRIAVIDGSPNEEMVHQAVCTVIDSYLEKNPQHIPRHRR